MSDDYKKPRPNLPLTVMDNLKFMASLAHFQPNPANHFDDELDLDLVALFAAYNAFERYVAKDDITILPTSPRQLEGILKRYSYDSIHNAISRSRSELPQGGYSRVCVLAENAIRDVLRTGDNTQFLLSMHNSPPSLDNRRLDESPPRSLQHGTTCK